MSIHCPTFLQEFRLESGIFKISFFGPLRGNWTLSNIQDMSIRPEVPYEDENEPEITGWREPYDSSVLQIHPEVPYDDNEPETADWRDPDIVVDRRNERLGQGGLSSSNLHDEDLNAQTRAPDDVWIVPPDMTMTDIVGERRSNFAEIRNDTGAYLEYNERKKQVDIWGAREPIQKAKEHLDLIVTKLMMRRDTGRRTKKWDKPERELTEKERKRAERLQARQLEEKSFQGQPAITQPFSAIFPIPDESLPIPKLLGDKESYLNSMRAECKAYMWYEPALKAIKISSQEEENVKMAGERIRNWYLRSSRRPISGVVRLMKQPKTNFVLRLNKLPEGLMTYRYDKPERQQDMLATHRVLESVRKGVMSTIKDTNLIDLEDSNPNSNDAFELPERVRTLDERNVEAATEALAVGLESIRLLDWEIRMKIRFGQICITDYPKRERLYEIEEITEKLFPNPRFRSELAPCIAVNKEDMGSFIAYVAEHGVMYASSPSTSYTITAEQYPRYVEKPPPGSRRDQQVLAMQRGNMWQTKILANFTPEGRINLWRCLTDCEDLVTISCVDMEANYSWENKLQYARRLPIDSKTPHADFAESLRLSGPDKRLVLLMNITDYHPHTVTQKTKWQYAYKEHWTIEICKDEIWDLDELNLSKERMALPVDLSSFEPHRVLFKVSLYCDSWVNRFWCNVDLRIGESPGWTVHDFLHSDTENTKTMMDMAQEIVGLLSKEVPLYYNRSPNVMEFLHN